MPGFTNVAVHAAECILNAADRDLPELQTYMFNGQLTLEQIHAMRAGTLIPSFSDDGNEMFLTEGDSK